MAEQTEKKDITQQPLLGTLVGLAVTFLVIGVAVYVIGYGYKKGQQAA